MRTRTFIWLAALPCAVLAIAVAVAGARPVESGNSTSLRSEHERSVQTSGTRGRSAISTSAPSRRARPIRISSPSSERIRVEPDFGKIVNRVDMPNVGDELHHFGYSR